MKFSKLPFKIGSLLIASTVFFTANTSPLTISAASTKNSTNSTILFENNASNATSKIIAENLSDASGQLLSKDITGDEQIPENEPLPESESLSNEDDIPTVPIKTSPSSIILESHDVQVQAGETVMITPVLEPEDSTVVIYTESADPSIAIAYNFPNEDGIRIKGITAGTTTITLTTSEQVVEVLNVTVTLPDGNPDTDPDEQERPITSLSTVAIKNKAFTIAKQQSRRLVFSITPKDTTTKLAFESENPKIAVVNEQGVVTGVREGTTIIKVMASDSVGKTLSLTVTVTKRGSGNTTTTSDLSIVRTSSKIYSYPRLSNDLKTLSKLYADRMSYHSIGTSLDGRKLYEVILGNPDAKKKIMVTANIHAREYMTAQLTMKLIEFYCKNYYTGMYEGSYFSELFENTAFYIVPMVNPDGATISQFGISPIRSPKLQKILQTIIKKYRYSSYDIKRWKSNARGVDLNRNFDCFWEYAGANLKPSGWNYRGPSVLSEPETQAIVNRFLEIEPVAELGYHATGSIIYHDYGTTGKLTRTNEKFYYAIRSLTGYSSAPSFSVYAAAGFGDWVTHEKGIPSLCIEIGVNAAPIPIREFPSVLSKNLFVYAKTAKLFS